MRKPILLAAAFLLAHAARADDSYGAQIVIADAISAGLGVAGLATRNVPLMVAGSAGWSLGGPIIHLGHGHGYRAGGSFGLRQLMPAGGFMLGAMLAPPCRSDSACTVSHALAGGLIGAGAGLIGASAIDALWLAREERPGFVVTGEGFAVQARFP